jgi:hypothetical protein|tara:strand:+ start:198 stop:419 length:222 start_codon:yes stop_codon:yes gene_type:complete
MTKFTPTETIQLDEVKRRIKEFKNGDKNATGIFLGYPSEVKSLVEKGILKPSYRETKRVLNWYDLTENGKNYV